MHNNFSVEGQYNIDHTPLCFRCQGKHKYKHFSKKKVSSFVFLMYRVLFIYIALSDKSDKVEMMTFIVIKRLPEVLVLLCVNLDYIRLTN